MWHISKIGYCVSVEGNVVYVCIVSAGKWPEVFESFMSLGPVELLFVLLKMANCTCVAVSHIFLEERVLIVWSMHLLLLFVLHGMTFVNCLLKTFALSMSVMAVLLSKQMLLFCCIGCFLLDSFAMLPHKECGLCL